VTCSGGQLLPEAVHDIPCEVSCEGGHYFDAASRSCSKCDAGTYAPSQLILFEDFTDEMPSQFDTFCVRENNDCQHWQLRGDYLDSGNNIDKHSVKSALVYSTEVEEGSKVSFEYMVFGEEFFHSMYDFLDFTIRNSQGTAESKLRAAVADEWTFVEYDVEPGFVEFTWTYEKDKYLSSSVPGGDRAKVRNIQVSKTVAKTPQCLDCPRGMFSDEGSSECMPCPPNTYAPDEKSSTCLPCPAFTKSYGGAVECEAASTPCKESDFYEHPASECTDNQLHIEYHWIFPQLCNDTAAESVSLPPSKDIPCPEVQCRAGQEPSTEDTTLCQNCPEGQVSTDGSACAQCELGHVPNAPTTYISRFERESGIFTTGCSNQCQSQGWRFLYDHADSGVGNGISESWIETTVNTEAGKTASFALDYTLQCNSGHGELQILINGGLSQIILCDGCSNVTKTTIVPLAPSPLTINNTIRINYRTFTNVNMNDMCDRATIEGITIIGEPAGGSTDCVPCGSGQKAEGLVCKTCPAGTHSAEMSAMCEPCPSNTFSSQGSEKCHECGKGMTSSVGASKCEWSAPLQFEQKVDGIDRQFDFGSLASALKASTSAYVDGWYYHINLEAKTSSSESNNKRSITASTSPCGPDTFVCRINAQGEVQDLGNSASLSASLGAVQLIATNYEANCNASLSADGSIATVVGLYCSLSASNSSNILVSRDNECSYSLRIESQYACPLCNNGDFYSYNDACVGGERQIVYKSLGGPEHQCFSGYAPPTNETTTAGCTDVVISSSQWWIVLIVFACVATIAILFFSLSCVMGYCTYKFYSKYKTVEIEKQQLLASRQNVEMADDHMDEMDKHDGSGAGRRSRKDEIDVTGSTNHI